jgi:hypothetical protein
MNSVSWAMERILKNAVYTLDCTLPMAKSAFGKNDCMERRNLGGSTAVPQPSSRARGRFDDAPRQTLYNGKAVNEAAFSRHAKDRPLF